MTPGAARPTPALAGLCVIEFCSWGVLYHTSPVIGTAITGQARWPPITIPVVYTASLLVAAAAAVALALGSYRSAALALALLGVSAVAIARRA